MIRSFATFIVAMIAAMALSGCEGWDNYWDNNAGSSEPALPASETGTNPHNINWGVGHAGTASIHDVLASALQDWIGRMDSGQRYEVVDTEAFDEDFQVQVLGGEPCDEEGEDPCTGYVFGSLFYNGAVRDHQFNNPDELPADRNGDFWHCQDSQGNDMDNLYAWVGVINDVSTATNTIYEITSVFTNGAEVRIRLLDDGEFYRIDARFDDTTPGIISGVFHDVGALSNIEINREWYWASAHEIGNPLSAQAIALAADMLDCGFSAANMSASRFVAFDYN